MRPGTPRDPAWQREALRQQMLLRALWGDARPAVVEAWLRGDPAQRRRGLQAYRAHAGALAERALAAAFPTVAALVGPECLAGLARAFWHAQPPQDGDVDTWGAALPAFIDADAQLADVPYLADVARLDWAVHEAGRAADDTAPAQGVPRLVAHPPDRLRLHLRAGWAVCVSAHPLHAIWCAHRGRIDEPGRFDAAREALALGQGEAVRVRREGLSVRVDRIPAPVARFEQAVLAGRCLARALQAAGPGFALEDWLRAMLPLQGLAAVTHLDEVPTCTRPR